MKLFRQGESGHYTFVSPHSDPTGSERSVGPSSEVAFEGKGFSVGMVKSLPSGGSGAVIWHVGLENPTWEVLTDVSPRVNRAWKVAYGDTTHVFFEGASIYADTIWLWFGS